MITFISVSCGLWVKFEGSWNQLKLKLGVYVIEKYGQVYIKLFADSNCYDITAHLDLLIVNLF